MKGRIERVRAEGERRWSRQPRWARGVVLALAAAGAVVWRGRAAERAMVEAVEREWVVSLRLLVGVETFATVAAAGGVAWAAWGARSWLRRVWRWFRED